MKDILEISNDKGIAELVQRHLPIHIVCLEEKRLWGEIWKSVHFVFKTATQEQNKVYKVRCLYIVKDCLHLLDQLIICWNVQCWLWIEVIIEAFPPAAVLLGNIASISRGKKTFLLSTLKFFISTCCELVQRKLLSFVVIQVVRYCYTCFVLMSMWYSSWLCTIIMPLSKGPILWQWWHKKICIEELKHSGDSLGCLSYE